MKRKHHTGRRPPTLDPWLLGSLLACLLALLSPKPSNAQPAAQPEPTVVEAFDLLARRQGWVTADDRLFITSDAGVTWADRTPRPGASLPCARPRLWAVSFPDPLAGFVLLVCPEGPGRGPLAIARTANGGRSWLLLPMPASVTEAFPVPAGAAHLCFLNARTGWLAVDQLTGSNFRLGRLFATGDGGVSWSQVQAPVGGTFVLDAHGGWLSGGAAGDTLYHTADGGRTWSSVSSGFAQEEGWGDDAGAFYQLPALLGDGRALLAVSRAAPAGGSVRFYLLDAPAARWRLALSLPAEGEISPGTAVPLAALDAESWLTLLPGGDTLLRIVPVDGREPSWIALPVSRGSLVASIRSLDMAEDGVGWALARSGDCDPACHQDSALLLTTDGGAHWTPLSLPLRDGSEEGLPSAAAAGECAQQGTPEVGHEASTHTRTRSGQGFDTCNAPSLAALEVWSHHSPYQAINLYIGGANRGCNNSRLTSDYVEKATAQGWSLIPTWVGPQAACWGGQATKMSYDPGQAYAQGAAEAAAALDAAEDLGLATAGNGTVLYYDLEAYNTSDAPCRAAARSFIQGWTERLQALDQVAGAYGAGCASAPSDWAELPSPPQGLWAAHWIRDAYTPEATVWDVACLSNSLWTDHQRLRQYTGGHDEIWGGTNLTIDCDVLDGIVADLREIWSCAAGQLCWHVFLPQVSTKAR